MKLTVVEVDPGVKGDTAQGILVISRLSYCFPGKVSKSVRALNEEGILYRVKMICLKTENGENDMKCVVPL